MSYYAPGWVEEILKEKKMLEEQNARLINEIQTLRLKENSKITNEALKRPAIVSVCKKCGEGLAAGESHKHQDCYNLYSCARYNDKGNLIGYWCGYNTRY